MGKKEKFIENCLQILLYYLKSESSDKAVRITLSLIYDQGYSDAKEEMEGKVKPKLDEFKGDNFSNE